MPRRPLALAVALCALLVFAVPAVGRQVPPPKRIDPGVTAAGIDLSNLTVEEATARLTEQHGPRLAPDLVLGAAGVPWKLTIAEAKLRLDAGRPAKRALYSRAGVTAVPPAISHSRLAVAAFVQRVNGRVSRAARN